MAVYNDFIGFSFQPIIDGVPGQEVHSSELHILRVSDGSRYSENLLPTMKDQTAEIPGGDGMYWWQTQNTQRNFTINIAFDSVTEADRRKIMQTFNGKNLGYLIFDEVPFKRYTVKSTGTPNIKFICFQNGANRIYKGEGTLTFIAYYPYAISVHKYLDEFIGDRYSNLYEWSIASGMKETDTNYDDVSSTSILIYNAGDLETDLKLFYDLPLSNQLTINLDDTTKMIINSINASAAGDDDQICINTATHLIEGYKDGERSGKLYNSYISYGDFFKIPNDEEDHTISTSTLAAALEYDYIYF